MSRRGVRHTGRDGQSRRCVDYGPRTMARDRSYAALVLRTVGIVVAVAIALYLVYLLRRPIGWVLVAIFLAVALSGPVGWLERHRFRRGWAIATVYLALFLVPLGVGAVVVPPLVTQISAFVDEVPSYAQQAQEYVNENDRLRKLEKDYDIVGQLEEQAQKLPSKVGGDAAGTLRDVGLGLVNSIFALVNILVLTAFLLSGGKRWVDRAVEEVRPDRRPRVRRVLDRSSRAIGGYVAGALAIAFVAGCTSYVVMWLLGVPFRAPLAVFAGFMSLIPLVGATIAAVVIGLVTVFNDFPSDTIAWVIWAVVYQQIENNLLQPRIQSRTVDVQPFIVLVSVLFGGTLLGILGAIVAIPVAATIQVALREWWAWRDEQRRPPPAASETGDATVTGTV